MRTRTIVALLSCIALALSLYVTPSASAASAEDEVLQIAANFVKAMNTQNGELMSSLWYSSEASAFGPFKTVSFLFQGEINLYPKKWTRG